jgi:hypothetical protein
MRKVIILCTVSIAALGAQTRPSHALIQVLDLSGLSAQIKAYALQLEGVKTAVDTFNTVTQELHEVQQVFSEAQLIYNAASHVTSIAGAVGALGTLGVQDPLPFSVYSIENLMNARSAGGLIGQLGSLGTNYSTNLGNNTLFKPTFQSLGMTNLADRIQTASASQAVAENTFQTAQARMPLIRQLVNKLNTSPDPAEREALIARLTGEQNITTAATNEALSAQMMASAAKDAAELRNEQRTLQSDQAWLDEARAQTGTW